MSLRHLLSVAGCGLVLATLPAHAAFICWIERVEPAEEAVRVVFIDSYRPRVTPQDPPGNPAATMLREGDVKYLQGGPHDTCTLAGERRNGVLGVKVTASMHLPGLPLESKMQFIEGSR